MKVLRKKCTTTSANEVDTACHCLEMDNLDARPTIAVVLGLDHPHTRLIIWSDIDGYMPVHKGTRVLSLMITEGHEEQNTADVQALHHVFIIAHVDEDRVAS